MTVAVVGVRIARVGLGEVDKDFYLSWLMGHPESWTGETTIRTNLTPPYPRGYPQASLGPIYERQG
ncbi:hypothetical protein GCM10027580_06880 [Corynebacterium faecale]